MSTPRPPPIYAIIIGNSSYTGLPPLSGAQDVIDFTALLAERAPGCVLESLVDAGNREMQEVFKRFAGAMKEGCTIVFFAGHGWVVDGKHYLLGVDTPVTASKKVLFAQLRRCLCLEDMTEALQMSVLNGGITTGTILMFIDACRSVPLAGTRGSAAIEAGFGSSFSQSEPRKGFDLLHAFGGAEGKGGRESETSGGGFFTRSLLRWLTSNGHNADIRALLSVVGKELTLAGQRFCMQFRFSKMVVLLPPPVAWRLHEGDMKQQQRQLAVVEAAAERKKAPKEAKGPARPTAPVSTAPATPPVAAPVRSGASAVGVSLRQVRAKFTALTVQSMMDKVIPAADIAAATASALGAIAIEKLCHVYCCTVANICSGGQKEKNRAACGVGVINAVMAMMEAHPASADVQDRGCEVLRWLAENAKCAAHMRAGGRAAALLRQAKAAFPALDYLQEAAYMGLMLVEEPKLGQVVAQCSALGRRGESAEVIPAADIAGVTSPALAAVASEAVCAAYCSAISSVCDKEENRVACGLDVITAVLAMMEAHPASVVVQRRACGTLYQLAHSTECAAHMKAEGKAAALLRQAKAANPDDVTTQVLVGMGLVMLEEPELARILIQCTALEMQGESKEVIPAADVADVTSSVLAAISSEIVCKVYCKAMEVICAQKENCAAFGPVVVNAVMAIMEAHPASAMLQRQACWTLHELAKNGCAAPSRITALLQQAKAAHPHNGDLQSWADRILFFAELAQCVALMERGKKKEVIPAADIASITSSALAAVASVMVSTAYLDAVVRVCANKDEDLAACGAGVITAVLAMMETHPTSESVQQQACKALSQLTGNADCAARIRAEPRAAALLWHAKAAYPDDEDIQDRADGLLFVELVEQCKALRERGKKGVVPAAVIAGITSSALAAVASAVVCKAYCNAIGIMCAAEAGNSAACGAGVVTAVLAMMESHPASVEVQREACLSLHGLARNAKCAALMRAGGRALPLLRNARVAHTDDYMVPTWADGALDRLTGKFSDY